MRRGLAACAALCAALCAAARANAQDIPPTLLVYRAPDDCPPVGDFQLSVQRRSVRIHFVDEGSHDRELSIFVRKDGGALVGELRLIEANGTLRQRSVHFTTCSEAIEGLALIATVSLDPQALSGSSATAETPSSPDPAPAVSPKSDSGVTLATPGVTPNPTPHQPEAATHSGVEGGLGVELNAHFGALPKTAIGGTLFAELGSDSSHWFAPSMRVALTHVERRNLVEDDTALASFALTLVTLAACPIKLGGPALAFRPCAALSGGALRGWGSGTAQDYSRTRQYWSWGGTAQLSLRLGQALDLVADAGVGLTLSPAQYAFEPATGSAKVFWRTPSLYISTGFGFRLTL